MIDFHPALSSAPIVLLVCAFLLRILGYWFLRDRLWFIFRALLVLSCIAAPLTYFSGYITLNFLLPPLSAENILAVSIHQNRALIFLFSLIPTALLSYAELCKPRNLAVRFFTSGFLALSVIIGVFTAAFGGHLVFDLGFGTSMH